MKHCPKHDLTFGDGAQCWCCEEQELKASGKHEQAYKDAEFLTKRGGGAFQATAAHATMTMLSQLSPEQLANLVALAHATQQGTVHPGLKVPLDQLAALQDVGKKRAIA